MRHQFARIYREPECTGWSCPLVGVAHLRNSRQDSLVVLVNATRSALIRALSLIRFSSTCQIPCSGHVHLEHGPSLQLSQPSLGSGCQEGRTCVPGSLPLLSVPTGTSHSHIYITVTSSLTTDVCGVLPKQHSSPHTTQNTPFFKTAKHVGHWAAS